MLRRTPATCQVTVTADRIKIRVEELKGVESSALYIRQASFCEGHKISTRWHNTRGSQRARSGGVPILRHLDVEEGAVDEVAGAFCYPKYQQDYTGQRL